ncbi:barstar family protein [Streptomyces lincolnensis]|uniref:barstar family protein n=1 Tax=Streptomyces lincolnensis TaxID=1915 RepID=UPI0037CFFF3D
MSTTAWIRPLTEAVDGLPAPKDVRGSACRTLQGLFTEWAAALGFPDYFGGTWDAFRDCLTDTVLDAYPHTTVVLREAGELLVDEPENVLTVLLEILGEAAGEGNARVTAPRLLLLLDDTPDGLAHLTVRLAHAKR